MIDPGVVKQRFYDPRRSMEILAVVPVSKAQARQRAGRAGREAPGTCYRLYPEPAFFKLEESTVPEILRCNLSNIVLQLLALGIKVGFGGGDGGGEGGLLRAIAVCDCSVVRLRCSRRVRLSRCLAPGHGQL